jgi:hypothetical protein
MCTTMAARAITIPRPIAASGVSTGRIPA